MKESKSMMLYSFYCIFILFAHILPINALEEKIRTSSVNYLPINILENIRVFIQMNMTH